MPAIDELEKTVTGLEIIWRAFELRPEPEPLPDATSEFFTNMWESSIYPLAESLRVKIKMPTVKPRSRIAHQAAKWAETYGKFNEFKGEIFRAYFERDENIGELETIVSAVQNIDLDSDELRTVIERNEFLEMVLADEEAARELGISGVPAFIANRKAGMMGIQSVGNLRNLVEQVKTVSS